MRTIGIDPGITGAIALYDTRGPARVEDLPTIGIGASQMLDAAALFDLVTQWKPDEIVTEYATAMPKQGVSSVFKYGKAFGQLLGVIQISGVPWHVVPSRKWKTFYRLGPDKELSRAAALRLFPDLHGELFLKKHHQRAEALLIARYLHDAHGFAVANKRGNSGGQAVGNPRSNKRRAGPGSYPKFGRDSEEPGSRQHSLDLGGGNGD